MALAKKTTKEFDTVVVEKDPTFARFVADKAVAIDLGREWEIAFLQVGPNITGITDVDVANEQINLSALVTEVSRVRMSGPASLSLVMNLLEQLARSDRIKVDRVVEEIRSWQQPSNEKANEITAP